jgi:hypothetical protein
VKIFHLENARVTYKNNALRITNSEEHTKKIDWVGTCEISEDQFVDLTESASVDNEQRYPIVVPVTVYDTVWAVDTTYVEVPTDKIDPLRAGVLLVAIVGLVIVFLIMISKIMEEDK